MDKSVLIRGNAPNVGQRPGHYAAFQMDRRPARRAVIRNAFKTEETSGDVQSNVDLVKYYSIFLLHHPADLHGKDWDYSCLVSEGGF